TIEDEGNQTQAKDVAKSISLLTAIHMLKKAWENVKTAILHIDDLDDELRAWINMDEDVPVVERNSIETIATSLLTTEDMEAAEETEDIEGISSTPPTSTEKA
ncbi:hypothetical protein QE152_g41358, partial [Popillia japonica]